VKPITAIVAEFELTSMFFIRSAAPPFLVWLRSAIFEVVNVWETGLPILVR
jgi:hypothetical protein